MTIDPRDVYSAPTIQAHIRWMIQGDMPEVEDIEYESFEFPWLKEDFIRCLRQRNCIGMVAEHEGRIAGFMIYELNKTRICLLSLAVGKRWRGYKIGTQMIKKLKEKLAPQRRTRIILEVRETNLAAQLFFKKNGFCAISVLRGYYEDTPEDTYLMQYRLREPQNKAFLTVNRISHFL